MKQIQVNSNIRPNNTILVANSNSFTKSGIKEGCKLYKENILLFRLLRILGCFPLVYNTKGKFELLWCSIEIIYTCFIIIISALLICISGSDVIEVLRGGAEFEQVIAIFCQAPLLIVQFSPAIVLYEAKSLVHYLNNWMEFEILYEKTLNQTVKLRTGRKLGCMGIICATMTIICSYVAMDFMAQQNSFLVFSKSPDVNMFTKLAAVWINTHGSCLFLNIMVLWYCLTSAFAASSEGIRHHLEVLISNPKCDLNKYLKLYMGICDLCDSFSDALPMTYLMLCAACFTSTLASLYVGFISLLHGNWALMLPGLLSLSFLTILVEITHRVLKEVDGKFKTSLRRRLIYMKDGEDFNTMKIFIQDVYSCSPKISLGGFCYLNRGVHMTMFSTLLTYIIIILQFQPASQRNTL